MQQIYVCYGNCGVTEPFMVMAGALADEWGLPSMLQNETR